MKVNVSLVAVSVRYGVGDAPQFVGLQMGGNWPTKGVRGTVSETVTALQESLPRELQPALKARAMEPQRITFFDRDGELTLIYSVALPIPLGDIEMDGAEWVSLLEPASKHADARLLGSKAVADIKGAESQLEWWKEFLEEKAGVLAFLPEYFTARLARDVYSAIWGYWQDADSFAKWSGIGAGQDGQLSQWVENLGPLAKGSLADRLAEALIAAGGDDSEVARGLAAEAAEKASRDAIGLDPNVAVAGVPRHVLSTAASIVAFQRQGVRGPKPAWFRQLRGVEAAGSKLRELYTPRPTWAYPAVDGSSG